MNSYHHHHHTTSLQLLLHQLAFAAIAIVILEPHSHDATASAAAWNVNLLRHHQHHHHRSWATTTTTITSATSTLRFLVPNSTNENRSNDMMAVSVARLREEDHAAAAAAQQQPQKKKFGLLRDDTAADESDDAHPLLLAIITEPDACDSDERLNDTLQRLHQAVATRQVDLVSIRVGDGQQRPQEQQQRISATEQTTRTATVGAAAKNEKRQCFDDKARRVDHLAKCLWQWSQEFDFNVVLSSDWVVSSLPSQLLYDGGRVEKDQEVLTNKSSETEGKRMAATMKVDDILQSVHGIHVKESHQCYIPFFRACLQLEQRSGRHHADLSRSSSSSNDDDDTSEHQVSPSFSTLPGLLIGTSAHSVDSAVQAYREFQPDYFFVGTCYPTLSHPEKQQHRPAQEAVIPNDRSSSSSFVPFLEGPELPGQVARALDKETAQRRLETNNVSTTAKRLSCDRRPRVFAIGGIDATNSHVPVEQGADGVATIRSILKAADPTRAVRKIINNMVKGQGE